MIRHHIAQVTNNTKQGLIVIGLTVLPFLIIGFIGFRQHLRAEKRAADSSVEASLRQSYRERFESNSLVMVPLAGLQEAFCNKENQLKFTGFPKPDQIWLASEPVTTGSTNLLCVVAVFEKGRAGIDARGNYRKVLEAEFEKWPHVSAKDAPPRDWGYFTH